MWSIDSSSFKGSLKQTKAKKNLTNYPKGVSQKVSEWMTKHSTKSYFENSLWGITIMNQYSRKHNFTTKKENVCYFSLQTSNMLIILLKILDFNKRTLKFIEISPVQKTLGLPWKYIVLLIRIGFFEHEFIKLCYRELHCTQL